MGTFTNSEAPDEMPLDVFISSRTTLFVKKKKRSLDNQNIFCFNI